MFSSSQTSELKTLCASLTSSLAVAESRAADAEEALWALIHSLGWRADAAALSGFLERLIPGEANKRVGGMDLEGLARDLRRAQIVGQPLARSAVELVGIYGNYGSATKNDFMSASFFSGLQRSLLGLHKPCFFRNRRTSLLCSCDHGLAYLPPRKYGRGRSYLSQK